MRRNNGFSQRSEHDRRSTKNTDLKENRQSDRQAKLQDAFHPFRVDFFPMSKRLGALIGFILKIYSARVMTINHCKIAVAKPQPALPKAGTGPIPYINT